MRRLTVSSLAVCVALAALGGHASAQVNCDDDSEPPIVAVGRPVVTYLLKDHWERNWSYVVDECEISWTDNCSPPAGIVHGTSEIISLSGEEIGGQPGAWTGPGIAADWVGYGLNLDRTVIGARDYLFIYAVIDHSWNWSYVECTIRVVDDLADACDGIDNDQDGQIDEDFAPQPVSCGVGACASAGQTICIDGVIADDCEPGQPNPELCGTGIDEDCDGTLDNGFDVGGACVLGIGACESTGFRVCTADGLGTECDAVPGQPQEEQCGTGIDEDCDGTLDNGFDVGGACVLGIGACENTGFRVCTADGLGTECDAVPGQPQEELCGTGIDEDCDGEIDEGFDPNLPCSDPVEDCDSDLVPPQVTVGQPIATFELADSWVNYIRVEDACQLTWTDGCTIGGDIVHGISNLESLSGEDIQGEPGGFYSGGIRAEWHTIDLNLNALEVGPRAYLITYAVIDRAWNWSYVSCTIEIVGEASVDAGVPDAGLPDAGPPDASPPDASPPDASPPDVAPPDIAPPDIAPPDSGAQVDSGGEDRTHFITFTRGQNYNEELDRINITSGGEIWIVDPANPAGARPVVADPGAGSLMADWSPGKDRLVFASNRGGDFTVDPSPFLELWVVDVDSGELTRIVEAEGGHNWTAGWSPTGNLIAFSSTRNHADPDDVDNLDLWVVNPDGTSPRMIYDGGGQDEDPVFSADGQTIYFMTGQTTGPCLYQIWQIDVDIGQPSAQPVVDAFGVPLCGEDISASKDGQWGYYVVSHGPDRNHFARWNIATGETTVFNAVIEPCIGPDGTRVAHIYWVNGAQGGGHVLVSNVDGSNLEYITTSGRDFYPRW